MTIFIASIVIALGVSGLCSLMESVLLSLTPGDIAKISSRSPKIGEIWTQFKKNIERPIAVILLLNTTAHTIGAAVAGATFPFGSKWIWLFSLIFTFLMLQYTEILPKTIGVRFNRQLGVVFARPLFYAIRVFSPMIGLIQFFNKPFEFKKQKESSTMDEITLMAAMARQRHLIGVQQEQIIVGAIKISEMPLTSVMLPIDETVMFSDTMSLWEAVELAHMDAHTRFPVYHGNDRNAICGYVNFKEIIAHQRLNPSATEFQEIVRPITFALPTTKVSEQLKMFTQQHEHIAIVRDEQGNCIGLVALEDLVEELVGEIEDEFDRLPRTIHVLPNRVLLLGGGCSMREVRILLEKTYAIDVFDSIPENQMIGSSTGSIAARHPGDMDIPEKSLAFWLERKLGIRPKRGDQFEYKGILFTVRRIRRGRIFDVQVQGVK